MRTTIRTFCLPVSLMLLMIAGIAPTDEASANDTQAANTAAPAPEMTGLEAARRMDDASRSRTEHNVMTMTLESSRGQKRIRTIEGWSREVQRDEEHRFARFLEPADVKDTTLLTYDYDDKDDDIWLYLPALKKVKRILSSNKTDYFMGSDFTYWDMENIDLKNWAYELTGREDVDGTKTVVITSTPTTPKEIEECGYSKVVYWVGAEDWTPRRIEYTDTKNRLAKRLTISDVRSTAPGDARVRGHTLVMDNLLTEHRTTIQYGTLELDVAVDDGLFSQRNLMP
jgi:hypothetical protein